MALRPRLAIKTPADQTVEPTPPLDAQDQDGQSSRTGLVGEADIEVSRRVARQLGWKPKEEWERAPTNWKDAPEFLEETPRKFEELQARNRAAEDRVKRTVQATADALEESRRQARIEAQAEVRAAAEAQDPERVIKAAEQLATVSGPPPQTVAWLGRNQWFNSDPDAQAFATAVVNRSARAGATIDEQLENAERETRKRFPEHFETARPEEPATDTRYDPERDKPRADPNAEVRLSESRRIAAAPQVAQGSRSGSGAPKERGYNDISGADRGLFEQKLLRKYMGRGMTEQEAKTKYAASYWREQGN